MRETDEVRAPARAKSGGRDRRASSNPPWLAVGVALAVALTGIAAPAASAQATAASARAQDSARVAADSLAARLARAERAIALLQRQVAEQSESGVSTRSGAKLEFSGRVVVNGFSNTRRVNNVDNPQFVKLDSAMALPARGAGMAARQTMLGLAVMVPHVLGGAFTGDVDVDFYGGQQPSGGGRTFPLVRLRTARAFVRWSHAEVMVGQEMPLFSPQNPVSPAATGTPEFAGAGNLWLWLPQVRLTGELGGAFRIGLQVAALAPTSGDPAGAFDTDVDQAERSRRPYAQARLRARWGSSDMAGEIGCSAHQGWLAVADSLVSSDALGCDLRVPITGWLEVRGEVFQGQALRGLGGGGISQNFGTGSAATTPLKTQGGWAQVNLRPIHALSLGGACGIDDPQDDSLATPVRLENSACSVYVLTRPAGPLFIGIEARRLTTTYANGFVGNDHLNLALGFEF